jgi:hypothetical protein
LWWGEASRAMASAPPSASRTFIIRAGKEGVPSWVLPPTWVGDPLLPPIIRGRWTSSSPTEEASSNHAGEGELLLPGQGVVVRPPPGQRSCRAQVAAVAGAEVVAAIGEASHRSSGCFRRRDRQCRLRSGPSALWL